jgi:hypothetical protein
MASCGCMGPGVGDHGASQSWEWGYGGRASQPNMALEPTRNSLQSCLAPAIARGSPPGSAAVYHKTRMNMTALPVAFLDRLRALEGAYLRETDPVRQSGFGGGHERWHMERTLVLDAVPDDGDFLDVGCANGYLLECLVQ